jgi:SNF2 family DNA or RNA helicase
MKSTGVLERLPQKSEIVIALALTKLQAVMYKRYMDHVATIPKITILEHCHYLSRLTLHPLLTLVRKRKYTKKARREDDEDEDNDDDDKDCNVNVEKVIRTIFADLVTETDFKLKESPKIFILLKMIMHFLKNGDNCVIFSYRTQFLDCIQKFLEVLKKGKSIST